MILLFAVLLLVLSLTGCEKRKNGCYETKSVFTHDFGSDVTYCCYQTDDPAGPFGVERINTSTSSFTTIVYEVWYEDESCYSLGYKEGGGNNFKNREGTDKPTENSYWGTN